MSNKQYKVEASPSRKTNVASKPPRLAKSPKESTEEFTESRQMSGSEIRPKSRSRSPHQNHQHPHGSTNKGNFSNAVPQELFHDDDHAPHGPQRHSRSKEGNKDLDKDKDNPPSSDSKSESGASSTSNLSNSPGFCARHMKYFNVATWFERFNRQEEDPVLTTEEEQRRFFCLVMSGKSGQLICIALAILLPTYHRPLHDFLNEYHSYWAYIPFGTAFAMGTIVRVFPFSRKLDSRIQALLLVLVTSCYAYVMSSLSVRYKSLIVEKVFHLLSATCIFLTLFVITVNISVVKKMLYISATSSVIFFATTMALLPPVFQADPSFELSLDVWLPAVIASEILIYLLVFEIQSAMVGERVSLRRDWLYLTLYL